ncbi:23S rRNA (uracil(1939)-C(5))-methyltransferase RlmD [Vagococcus humatus]|uniref:23S rRNA (Uracil(1939)-C(5))-methyltransferase RlmD n=1 Tax=Vagococcus humatus TaxID=1889241 RepID=A0A3S0AB40_9ENTE|nr:23S rRNA (uracil(1939)-C(5))-methyltransferase RlmD [Vagococcus humatus]RST88751.1 23S rRNA (uracil(1939)-C(5))-methyltransferase RlmD [Vagococcus humatus]
MEYPVKKNQQLLVEIIDLTHEGLGVAKVDGYPLFIENTLPGEQVEILVLKVGKKFGFGKVVKQVTVSEDRVEQVDETFIRTGIAPLIHLTYEKQLAFKQDQVKNVFERIAKLPEVPVLKTLGMENPTHYRNKAQIPVRKINNQLETGFFRKNSHDLVPIENFLIQEDPIDDAIKIVRDIMRRFNVKPYNEQEHVGNLRHIIIRQGHYTKEMMVVLVTRTAKLFPQKNIIAAIKEALPQVVSIVQNVQPEKSNVILGKETKILDGEEAFTDQLLGNEYRISAESFYQVNTKQAEVLYQTAIDFADFSQEDQVIDAYCGIGTIALSLANQVAHVTGIEVVPQAIEDAKVNAELNNITNADFVVGKAEEVMDEWVKENKQCDVLVVDPPRKGLEEMFIEKTVELGPKKMVYISCNPASLARDCAHLVEHGYTVKKVQPVDMFPQTAHVECVALLEK